VNGSVIVSETYRDNERALIAAALSEIEPLVELVEQFCPVETVN